MTRPRLRGLHALEAGASGVKYIMSSVLDIMSSISYIFGMIDRTNGRRYLLELSGALLFYIAALLLSLTLLERPALTGLERTLAALLPVPGIMLLFCAMARHVARIDELQRQILLEGMAVAGGITAMLAMTATFLENAGIANPPPWVWFVCFMAILPFGAAYAHRRYE